MATHPDRYPQTRGRRGNGGRRPDLDNRYFRSAWEANWARYLNWLKERGEIERWEFESETFEFPVKRGSRFYTPDFKVFDSSGGFEYHEVKGYMDQRSATKLARMRRHYSHLRVKLIDSPVYRQIAATIGPLIPHWEMIRGKTARHD